MRFIDGLKSLVNDLINSRAAINTNRFSVNLLDNEELKAIFLSGLGNKIVRIKTGAALSDTVKFKSEKDQDLYDKVLHKHIKNATRFMIAFGRGIIVIYNPGDDLSRPLSVSNTDNIKLKVFSGDMVTAQDVSQDLMDERYYKPRLYQVRYENIHHSRVIDFTYVSPVENDLPTYNYGGVSEYQLVYEQLINDGIIQRSVPAILDKSSSIFYKREGFNEAVTQKKENAIKAAFTLTEGMRSISGATLMDSNDTVEVHSQSLTNLSDVDNISLRRTAMVTGIPLPYLVGEAVQGLNSTGDNERMIWGDTVEHLQYDYILPPMLELTEKLKMGVPTFDKKQGISKREEAEIEKITLENAMNMRMLGADYNAYLEGKGFVSESLGFDDPE